MCAYLCVDTEDRNPGLPDGPAHHIDQVNVVQQHLILLLDIFQRVDCSGGLYPLMVSQ